MPTDLPNSFNSFHEVPLITKADIAAVLDIDLNLRDEFVNPIIIQAQNFDLRPVMGDNLYVDFMQKVFFQSPEDPMYLYYQVLLNGYTDPNFNSFYFELGTLAVIFHGLKPILAHFAAARIIRKNNFKVTSWGNAKKNNQDSTNPSSGEINEAINSHQSMANSYLNEMNQFLTLNWNYYKFYIGFDRNNKGTGAKISSINKMDRDKNGRDSDRNFDGFLVIPKTN